MVTRRMAIDAALHGLQGVRRNVLDQDHSVTDPA
jgi:hypothetical protein